MSKEFIPGFKDFVAYAVLDKLAELLGIPDKQRCDKCWDVLDEHGVCPSCREPDQPKEHDDDKEDAR